MYDVPPINEHAGRYAGEKTAGEIIRSGAKQLKALNASTEEDFLSIGAYLQDLSRRAASIAKAAESVVGLVTGEEVGKDTERLGDAVRSVDEYFRESQVKFERDSGSLLRMLHVVETAYRPLSVFKTIVKHLHMLGVSTRIENARLNEDGGFDTLAEHVEKLSVVIASKSDGILKGLIALHKAVKQTLSMIFAARDATHDRTLEILDGLASSLSTLSEKRGSSSQTAIRLASGSEEVSADMSEVISSLQFHDITRQQIEHVIDAFDELAGEDAIVEVIFEIGGLQIDQLDHARGEISSAVGRMMDGLHGIAARLSGMVKETETLTGASGREHSSFLSDLGRSVSFVIGSLDRNGDTDKELGGAVDYVSGLIENLSAFVNDIEEIASEIELIAINAQIRAARTEDNGGALGVLAEAIRALSDTTRGQTVEMTGTLTQVSDTALQLRTTGDARGRKSEIGAITAGMAPLLESLARSQERLLTLLDGLEKESRELTSGIERVVEGITAHERTNEVVNGVIAGLRQVTALRKPATGARPGSGADPLGKLAARYTMNQERSLHQAHMDRINGTRSMVEEKGFAGNVELF